VTRPPCAAAILAGGKARRFGGQDKCRLVVGGVPIIVRQLVVLQRVARTIFIIAPEAARFADLGLPVYADLIPDIGAIGGLYTALEAAGEDLVFAVACDLPFLDAGVLTSLADLASGADGAWVRTPGGVEPLLACYRRAARTTLRREIDAGRLKLADLGRVLDMRELAGAELARFGPVERLAANINSPDDFARIQ
jgi:molybdopterin-guanine dinucleotide biosynthesis protein A